MLKKMILNTDDSKSTLLIRLLVSTIFISEGLQKFMIPEVRGAGRFITLGLPNPEFLSYFVASFEILCGVLLVFGFITRFASLPLIIIMLVAGITTKTDVFLEKGFWELMHGIRTDLSMLICNIFLLIKGGGYFSIDYKLQKKVISKKK